jgi:hypothetical protein
MAMFESGTWRGVNAGWKLCAVNEFSERFLGGMGSAWVAQLVERVLGKDEVTGSIPVPGSRSWSFAGSKFLQAWAGVTQR